jgi:hypothetical protein
MVAGDGTEVVVDRVDARTPDLALVDALLRYRLAARRCGCSLVLRDVPDALRELLTFVGVAAELGLETRREAELGEQLGIEEVMQAPDAPA